MNSIGSKYSKYIDTINNFISIYKWSIYWLYLLLLSFSIVKYLMNIIMNSIGTICRRHVMTCKMLVLTKTPPLYNGVLTPCC